MDERTVRALGAINRAFYRDHAAEFSDARREPWPGWDRLQSLVDARVPEDDLSVLDVGCGHGRFAAYLDARRRTFRYLGIDASDPLLERARARDLRGGDAAYLRADFAADDLESQLPARRFALIALFGALHHVPGEARRRALLAVLAGRLAPGGLLALTSWQFEAFERFRSRVVPWEDYNRGAAEPVDVAQLEPGDHLLPWGEGGGAVRYCHFSDDAEIRRLLAGLPLRSLATYASDGRGGNLNRYYVLESAPVAGTGERRGRRRLEGIAAIERALSRGEPLRLIVAPGDSRDAEVAALCERADAAGVPVLRVSERQFERLAPAGAPCAALGLAGAAPDASADEVLAAGGAAWLLTGTAYPGNAGFAIRTAEASGADGIFIDADFDHAGRREAARVSMRADRFLPVFWERSATVLEAARRAGRRLVAIEDSGDHAPWEEDLTGPVLFVVGHEKAGVAAGDLARCDSVVRIPMSGFLRAYNLHAAVAAVAAERLRQEES